MRVLTVGLLVAACTIAQELPRAFWEAPLVREGQYVLWHDPGAVERLDLRHGIGGEELAPKAPFTYEDEDTGGTTPKVKVKDANGRFIKTNIVAYNVMEKRAGWGTEYPDDIRNGEWEYQAFRPDKTPNTNANLTSCYTCHKPLGLKQDFVFTYERLKAATR